jgi:hypothetical protein
MNPTRHKKDLATLELQGFYKVDLGYEVNLKEKKTIKQHTKCVV